jgi:hypothetical protein
MNAAAFGANLRDKIKAGTMTNAQAQAAHNAFVKQQMSPRAQAAAENASATLRAAEAKPVQTPPKNDPGGVSAAHVALGKQLQAQIASGQITTAQARDTLNKNSPALRQLADMKAKSQAAAAPPEMNKTFNDYRSDKGASGGNPLGQLRPGLGGVPSSQSPTQTGSQQPARELPTQSGYQQSQQQPQVSRPSPGISQLPGMTPPKSSAPYMPSATAPTGPAPAGPPTTPTAAMRMKKGGKVSKPVKKMAKGGSTASSRGDGCAVRGKTKGTMR